MHYLNIEQSHIAPLDSSLLNPNAVWSPDEKLTFNMQPRHIVHVHKVGDEAIVSRRCTQLCCIVVVFLGVRIY